jgi:hypothetical protein
MTIEKKECVSVVKAKLFDEKIAQLSGIIRSELQRRKSRIASGIVIDADND